jgi:hypothetical protein
MTNEYTITGTKHERFSLTFSSGGAQLTSSVIEDGRAELVQDTGFGVVTTELQCDDGC